MSKRKEDFYIGEYYHIFNRGVDKRKIFLDKGDLYYFFDAIQISNRKGKIQNSNNKGRKKEKERAKKDEKIVEIISYCLLPNHFHFILKEITEGGISKFMSKLGGSYSQYFNSKYERSGTLFQGRFKAKRISGIGKRDFSIEVISAYVNLNYKHHNYDIKKDLIKTSLFEYLGEEKWEKICNQNEIKKIIKSVGGLDRYKKWIKELSKEFTRKHKKDLDSIDFRELE